MSNTKKILTVLMAVSLMVVSFVPVFADTATQAGISDSAKICADLGMLKGTGSGVTIEYTSVSPDRLTAATLLLRLMGLENEALATKDTENFSDASLANANGQKIMTYLKANPSLGFVGFPNGKFGPKDKITAQQYYKVLMTNLGYVSGIDFKDKDVLDFAATKGFTKVTSDIPFTIDSLAVATVEALRSVANGGRETWAATLAAAGKLDATAVSTAGLDKAPSAKQPIDSTAAYMSKGENFGWQNYAYTLGTNTTGKQLVEYDVTALIDKVDGSVDFADSSTEVSGFSDLAMLVRLSGDGLFDVRNGTKGQQKIADVPFKANVKYHVEVYADMNARRYSVFVTTPDGVRTQVAKDFEFRASAPDTDDIGQVFFISAAANDQLKVENLTRRALLDSAAAYMSKGENLGWQEYGYYMGSKNMGKQQIDFDMTAIIDKVDGSVDFADSSTVVGGFSDLAMLVRMSADGFIDVRNGASGQQKLVDFVYSANTKYHVEIQADMAAKTYSVFVTAPGGQKTQIAKDYKFRASAPDTDDVGQVFVISAAANDQVKAENITIKAVQ